MLGKAGWAFSLDEGTLAFRLPHETLQLAVQVLGTESTAEHTWLWAWGNTESVIPTHLLSSTEQLRAIGQTEPVPEFNVAQVPLGTGIDGSRIAAIATGVCRAACYFRVAYPNGILYMLIKDARYKRSVRHPLQRIARVFPLFAREIAISQQHEAYLHYLSFYRLVVQQDGHCIYAYPAQPIGGAPARETQTATAEQLDPLQLKATQPQCLIADVDATGQVIIRPLR